MDVFEAIVTRRSIRKYQDIPVAWDLIGQILEAGKWAPSSGNLQNWKFIVIEDEEKREAVAEACLQQMWMAKAPVHILVVAELKRVEQFYGIRGERLYSVQNIAAAVQNMMLVAHSLGLGTCWVGAFDEEKLKSMFSIPSNVRPQAIITIGYADENPEPPQKYTLEDVMYFRAFGGQGNRIKDIDEYLGYTSKKLQDAMKKGKSLMKKIGDKVQDSLKKK